MYLEVTTGVVLPVFLVVAVGWLLAQRRIIEMNGLSALLWYAALPALILHSLTEHRPSAADLAQVAGAALAVVTVVGCVSWLLARALGMPTRGVVLTATFMNAGNFGMSLALLAWGKEGLAVAALYYVVVATAHNSVGAWLARGDSAGWREMFRVPLLYAALVGLLLAWADLRLPTLVEKPLGLLAQTAVPLMLLSLGHALQRAKVNSLRPALLAVVLRMAGGFAVALLVVELAGFDGLLRKVVLLSSSMPAAVLNIVFAHRYRADPGVVGSAVLISTAVAALTVPLLLGWLG